MEVAKIESYIVKKGLQNEKGLDKYIEMILTEKAEKKSNLAPTKIYNYGLI
jgi:hypothetical protein